MFGGASVANGTRLLDVVLSRHRLIVSRCHRRETARSSCFFPASPQRDVRVNLARFSFSSRPPFSRTTRLNVLPIPSGCLEKKNLDQRRPTNDDRQVGLLLPEAAPHRGSATPLAGLRALDVGCGGGLLSEVRRGCDSGIACTGTRLRFRFSSLDCPNKLGSEGGWRSRRERSRTFVRSGGNTVSSICVQQINIWPPSPPGGRQTRSVQLSARRLPIMRRCFNGGRAGGWVGG